MQHRDAVGLAKPRNKGSPRSKKPKALVTYKLIHASHPENIECLRYLVHICTDLNLKKEVQEYVMKLRKVERSNAQENSIVDSMTDLSNSAGTISKTIESPINIAPKASFNTQQKVQLQKHVDDDDWGDDDLGDDLLPM